MTHGVVVCPKCKHVKAADLQYKTTRCLDCGKVMKLTDTKIWAKTDDNDQIAVIVGNVKAQLNNVTIEYPAPARRKPKKKTLSPGSKREKLVFQTAIALTNKNSMFSLDDFHKALKKVIEEIKKEDTMRYIEQLRAKGVLLEPKQGTYRTIEDQI